MKKSTSRAAVLTGAFAIGCTAPAAVRAPAAAPTSVTARSVPASVETARVASPAPVEKPFLLMTNASPQELADAVAACPKEPIVYCLDHPALASRVAALNSDGATEVKAAPGQKGVPCDSLIAPLDNGGHRTMQVTFTLSSAKDGDMTTISGVCAPNASDPCGPLYCLDKSRIVTDAPQSSKAAIRPGVR